ncbi:MAG: NADH-quinone oxidoreductase subunit J [Bacteriovoracaceae bacterium]|nr:NADH-quinone oxidoreductase subunit J [Bacteriovoracaceae bacterium]
MLFLNVLFGVSAVLTIASSLLCVFTKNIMHACVYLLGALLGVAGLYMTLGADFVAVTQIMVYVGGIVILMLFAVMLTGGKEFVSKAQKLLNLVPLMGNKWTFLIASLASLVFAGVTVQLYFKLPEFFKTVDNTEFSSTVDELGKLLITDHLLAFELSSVLLLGALVGAAIIARPRKEEVK